ncbi:cation diffusion facilitator family transporter [Paramicrobacterium agarici]|uniref:Cation diffusion facilitator family transporter n=1 Tax=Paramicrobacterium agarici TaxID=630514 RepID=A0A2A9DTB2_9MICO|nr:cation diffusion facilitator family transporter [Microbacterium agarici]PFG29385.1 cation diffusion facilitator family transporter [Microbacterium agarici]
MIPPIDQKLPQEQQEALRKAIWLEWATIAYAVFTITIVFFVLGNSQAMKTAWIEDMISTTPQLAFLVAISIVAKKPTRKHPYGFHRAMEVGHLVAGVALGIVGLILIVDATTGLVKQEHPTIGTVNLWGNTIWLGWLMMIVMALIAAPPVLLGRAKMKVAGPLHNKLLFADADMAKADWTTNVGSIVGVAGIGVGIWWMDSAAAIFISIGILWDGIKNTRASILDLVDQRATTFDQKQVHPLVDKVHDYLGSLSWVTDVGSRVRDEGQVFHVEAFVVPRRGKVTTELLRAARVECMRLDWKLQDVAIIPVPEIPRTAMRDRDGASP